MIFIMLFMTAFAFADVNPTSNVYDAASTVWYFANAQTVGITDAVDAKTALSNPAAYGYLYKVDIGNGVLFTGWYLDMNDNYHYFDVTGTAVVDKWVGNYYLMKNGMLARSTWIGDYYVDSTGKYQPNATVNGWTHNSRGWRFVKPDGTYAIGWYQVKWVNGNTESANGVAAYGSKTPVTKTLRNSEDYWYYFNAQGYMLSDSWVNDYFVGKDGTMYVDTWVPNIDGVGTYYVGKDGKWVPGLTSGTILHENTIVNRTENAGTYAYKIVNGVQVPVRNEWYNNHYYNDQGFMVKDQWVGDYLVDASGMKVGIGHSLWTGGFYLNYNDAASANWNKTHAVKVSPIDDNQYFIKANGEAIANSWIYSDGSNSAFAAGWYYVGANYKLVKNNWVGNYYVGADGHMLTNTWIGEYFVGADGKVID